MFIVVIKLKVIIDKIIAYLSIMQIVILFKQKTKLGNIISQNKKII